MDPALPGGTVTFLFTDIEGSTRLWDAFPDDMRLALSLHDRAVEAAVATCGGHVVKNTGDGMFAAFSSAPEAAAAAVAAQQALASMEWPVVIGSLGVRMALHTAEVFPTGDDYLSPEVNRVARIEAAGHGGQVLLSQTTADLVRDTLADWRDQVAELAALGFGEVAAAGSAVEVGVVAAVGCHAGEVSGEAVDAGAVSAGGVDGFGELVQLGDDIRNLGVQKGQHATDLPTLIR